jgi:NADPH-dependent curcumin reductase CurA
MSEINRAWTLANHPDGMPAPSDWVMEERPRPEPAEGQVLARAIYLSVDPYMRGRISKASNYAAGVGIGDVMHGGAVGQVMESKHPDWKSGDLFETMGFGWQEWAVLDPATQGANGLRRVDPTLGPIHAYLSYLGMPGITAWLAMEDIGKPQAGQTVLVSAASGAVGQVVGQIAKDKGCRAVAVASTEEKLAWCRDIGFDVGVNYRAHEADILPAIQEACPDGIDIFFDNTAGPIHDAAMKCLAQNARIIICGMVANAASFDKPDMGERHLRRILVARARMEGFLIFDHMARWDAARRELAAMASDGRLQFKTDQLDGIDHMPQAFVNLLTSQNFGKQVVRVSDDPTE